jgi:serine/threonine protein kinase
VILEEAKHFLTLPDSDDWRLFIRFSSGSQLFFLSRRDTLASIGADERAELWLLGRDKWPRVFVPAVLASSLLNESDFEIIEAIGEGISGQVCLAKDTRTGCFVAVKDILGFGQSPETRLRGAVVQQSATHPTIAEFVGISLGTVLPHIYTRYYPNGSISDYLQSHRPISNTTKMMWIYGIAVGMAVLHSRRIQHRDLKPGNVLLDEALRPKIADFSSSKNVRGENSMRQSQPHGTYGYIAPEMIQEGDRSGPVDVYSFGMTVWTFVTGAVPFPGLTQFAMGTAVVQGKRPTLPSDLPAAMQDLISSCWCDNSSIRPTFRDIVRLLTESGPILPDVDRREYDPYVESLRDVRLKFVHGGTCVDCTFSLIDSIQAILWAGAKAVNRFVARLQFENQGRILGDCDQDIALDFTEDPVVWIRDREWEFSVLRDDQLLDIDVELPSHERLRMAVPRSMNIAGLKEKLIGDHGIQPDVLLLTVEHRRFEDGERLWGVRLPIIVEVPFFIPIHDAVNGSIVWKVSFLANDRVDDAKDLLRSMNGPSCVPRRIYADGKEPPGDRRMKDLTADHHWTCISVDPLCRSASFSATFNNACPCAGGVIRQLRQSEMLFAPQVIFSQSGIDVYHLIDSESDGYYAGHALGDAQLEFHFCEEINVTGIILTSHSLSFPRCFSVSTVKPDGSSQLLADVVDCQALNQENGRFCLTFDQPATQKVFRINQTSPNWHGLAYFRLAKIEFLSDDPRYTTGVFNTLFRNYRRDIRKYVCVSARTNDPGRLYRFTGFFCKIFDAQGQPWLQTVFPNGRLEIAGYAVKRRVDSSMQAWSLRASNDESLPITQWAVLHAVSVDEGRNPHNPIEYFAVEPRFFICFRLVREPQGQENRYTLFLEGFELYGKYEGASP